MGSDGRVKHGCSGAQRGAFTVHDDGIARRSCQLQMSTLSDKRILTLDGLSSGVPQRLLPTAFVAYPIADHSPSDPVRYCDVSRRWIEWSHGTSTGFRRRVAAR